MLGPRWSSKFRFDSVGSPNCGPSTTLDVSRTLVEAGESALEEVPTAGWAAGVSSKACP